MIYRQKTLDADTHTRARAHTHTHTHTHIHTYTHTRTRVLTESRSVLLDATEKQVSYVNARTSRHFQGHAPEKEYV